MAEKDRRAKTETLSLRLDPKTRFILEFMTKVRGQSITVLIERSVRDLAERVRIGPTQDRRGNDVEQLDWTHFWDPSEGVRTLRLLACAEYPTDFAEDELKSFTDVHWPFFYTNAADHIVRRGYVEVLWPNVQEYLATWRETKTTNYWKAGEDMARSLSGARVAAPEWPAVPKKPVQAPAFEPAGMDDDIPF